MIEQLELANWALVGIISLAILVISGAILFRQNGYRLWKVPILLWLLCWLGIRVLLSLYFDGYIRIDTTTLDFLVTAVGIQGAATIGVVEFLKLLDNIKRNPERVTYFKEWVIQHWIKLRIHD